MLYKTPLRVPRRQNLLVPVPNMEAADASYLYAAKCNRERLRSTGNGKMVGQKPEDKLNMNTLLDNYTRGTGLLQGVRIIGVGLVAGLLAISSARAAIQMNTVEIQLNTAVTDPRSQSVPPDSSVQPWMDIIFQDIGPNTVRLTITAPHLTGPEQAENMYFNFNDTKNVNNLIFTPVFSEWQGVSHSYTLQEQKNNVNANQAGRYDIKLGFQTIQGASQ